MADAAAAQYPQPMVCPPMTYAQPAPNVVNYNVGRHRNRWDERQPIEQFLIEMGQRSWIRFEYMQMEIERPGDQAIGAPISNFSSATDVNETRQITDPITGTDFGFSTIPNLNDLTLDNAPGIRGTYGIWFNGGSIEFSVFGTEQVSDGFQLNDLQGNRQPDPTLPTPPSAALGTEFDPNIIIPLSLNGVSPTIPATGPITDLAVIGFDSSYQTSVRSQIWGSELNVLSAAVQQSDQLQWQWLGGFRYTSFDESFGQVGVRDNAGLISPPITTRIRSSVSNNVYGPSVGFRMSLASKYLTLSATPRVTFALNDYTSRLVASGDLPAPIVSETEEIDFTTLTQVSLLAEVNLTESFSLYGGYDFMWSYRMARPYRGINYDSTVPIGGNREARLGLSPDPESMYLQGFTFGATLRF